METTPLSVLFRILLWLALGLILSIICAEFTARILPVTKGLYRTHNTAQWPLHGYAPHLRYTYSLTWQMLFPNSGHTNNYGHLAPHDYVPAAHPIAIIGDSFVESQMNPYEQTVQGHLNARFRDSIPVYGFGFAGNSLAEYLAVARMAREEFSPVAQVFLVIDNDAKESWQRRIGHRSFAIAEGGITEEYWPLDRNGLAQRFRHSIGDSALYRYIQVNLGFTPDAIFKTHNHTRPSAPSSKISDEASEARSRLAIDYFLQKLPSAAGLPVDHIYLVFDSDRERIYDPTRPSRQGVDSATVQSYHKERARQMGYTVIDTSSLFTKHFAEHHRRFDFSPTDRHWNSLGHSVVADLLFECLRIALCGNDDRLRPETCRPLSIKNQTKLKETTCE